MLDPNLLQKDPEQVRLMLQNRHSDIQIDEILSLQQKTKAMLQHTQELQAEKNSLASKIGMIKAGKSTESLDEIMKQSELNKEKLSKSEEELKILESDLQHKMSFIPNILQDDVSSGESEADNQLIRVIGQKKEFTFTPKEHNIIGEALGLMDFESARKISGARFVVLRKELARLERALANFMLDTHTSQFGYTEVYVPQLVLEHSVYGTGQLPKFDNGYVTTDGMYLIPTSEVPITNLHREEILKVDELPLRYTGYTQCFRSESGAAGKDTTGMIRQHQFSKVEMVSITTQQQSKDEHERMLSAAENILTKLGLHYEIRILCAGDTGFASSKTYDINVWMCGQKRYREISSCSNMLDFQARRMMCRYKDVDGKNKYAHTLNGSGLATGRTMIAIIEQYQNSDGSFNIPQCLYSYMNGNETIRAQISDCEQ